MPILVTENEWLNFTWFNSIYVVRGRNLRPDSGRVKEVFYSRKIEICLVCGLRKRGIEGERNLGSLLDCWINKIIWEFYHKISLLKDGHQARPHATILVCLLVNFAIFNFQRIFLRLFKCNVDIWRKIALSTKILSLVPKYLVCLLVNFAIFNFQKIFFALIQV